MSELHRFPPADQDVLVSLFYRIGVWMSGIDDTDTGDRSENIENNLMLRTLGTIASSQMFGALTADIAFEALRQKGSWERWANTSDSALSDIPQVKSILEAQATGEETILYGNALIAIATSVARAYREADDVEDLNQSLWTRIQETKEHLVLRLLDRDSFADLNISPAEDTALQQLVEAWSQT